MSFSGLKRQLWNASNYGPIFIPTYYEERRTWVNVPHYAIIYLFSGTQSNPYKILSSECHRVKTIYQVSSFEIGFPGEFFCLPVFYTVKEDRFNHKELLLFIKGSLP